MVSMDREKVEAVSGFIFWGTRITADRDCSHEIKRCLLLGRKTMANLPMETIWTLWNVSVERAPTDKYKNKNVTGRICKF